MRDGMVAHIATRVSEITRQNLYSNLEITVVMPTAATETDPLFVVRAKHQRGAMDGAPTTSISIR